MLLHLEKTEVNNRKKSSHLVTPVCHAIAQSETAEALATLLEVLTHRNVHWYILVVED